MQRDSELHSSLDETLPSMQEVKQQSPPMYPKKTKRCGQCEGCRTSDCTTCKYCKDKKKFGGPGRLKKPCAKRFCTAKTVPSSIQSRTKSLPSTKGGQPQPIKAKLPEGFPVNNGMETKKTPEPENKQHCSINKLLHEQNRTIHPITGDGNCFFHSISYGLFHTEMEHLQVREQIANYISNNPHLFQPLLITDNPNYTLDDHVANIRKPTVWATQIELQAATDVYGIPLYLFTPKLSGSGYHWYCYKSRTPTMPKKKCTLHHFELAHKSGVHFDCIVDAATTKPSNVTPNLNKELIYHPTII